MDTINPPYKTNQRSRFIIPNCARMSIIKHTKALFGLILLASVLLLPARFGLAQSPPPILVAISGGYGPTSYGGFLNVILNRIPEGEIRILVLPIGYASHPNRMSDTDRAGYLKSAETRRSQIQVFCTQVAGTIRSCKTTLAPIFIRSEADDPEVRNLFSQDLAGIFILGGDASVAMQVISGTTLENAIAEAYQGGATIGGIGAGAAMMSKTMLANFMPGYDIRNALSFGSTDVWYGPQRRGLSFGITSAIIDHQIFKRGRISRMLNAISLPEAPHIGVGIDEDTGIYITGSEKLDSVFGRSGSIILDAETYHSADAVSYHQPGNLLSLRNVLLHLVGSGGSAYNFQSRQHSLVAPPPQIERRYIGMTLPVGAGTLLLTSNLGESTQKASSTRSVAINRFVNQSGGANAQILIVATGFADADRAMSIANQFETDIQAPSQIVITSNGKEQALQVPPDITGMVLLCDDLTLTDIDNLEELAQAWRNGLPLLTDGFGASLAGEYYVNLPPAFATADSSNPNGYRPMILRNNPIREGLALIQFNIEAKSQHDARWGAMISLAYNSPSRLAIGLRPGSALEINRDGAFVLGEDDLFVLDFSLATLSTGNNQTMVVANGLLDVFAPGETVRPNSADVSDSPLRLPTPESSTMPTQMAGTSPEQGQPTLLPHQPESTQVVRPPEIITPTPSIASVDQPMITDPLLLNLMVVIGILTAIIILFGVWINRGRPNMR